VRYGLRLSTPKNSLRYRNINGYNNSRGLLYSRYGDRSFRTGQDDYGDMRLVPLGKDAYALTYRDSQRRIYYYGLVTAPSQAVFQRRACKKAAELEKNRDLLQPSEIDAMQGSIRRLFVRCEALVKVQNLSARISAAESQLPEAALARLRDEAKQLLEVTEGRAELPGYQSSPVPGRDDSFRQSLIQEPQDVGTASQSARNQFRLCCRQP
jgi:hypothetical protein